jgi:lipoyl(octanoyl) transferase
MARDEHLLYADTLRPAALRLYGWTPPTISLGYFQEFSRVAALPSDVRDLAIVRRPTGGGAILHDEEITYCLVVDDSLPVTRQAPTTLYRLVHECWRDVLSAAGVTAELAPESFPMPAPRSGPFFCFEKPGQTDLIIPHTVAPSGMPLKLLGSAQRRIPGRVLQHGSLLLGRQFAAHPGADLGRPPADQVAQWGAAFGAALAARLGLTPVAAEWQPEQAPDIAIRRARYADDAWTRRR